MSPSAPHRATFLAALAALLLVPLAGCSEDRSVEGEKSKAPAGRSDPGRAETTAPPPDPAKGLGDILVDGRPVTGSQKSDVPGPVPFRRTYTDGELYGSVTGYRSTSFGAGGLEGAMKADIEAGRDVATTIDPEAQRAAFEGLRGRHGAAIALDAGTGDVVALVSAPGFDPAAFSGNSPEDAQAWQRVNDEKALPLFNRALRDVRNPGAAAHLIVATAALEEGVLDSVDSPVRAPAVYVVPDSKKRIGGDPDRCVDTTLRDAWRHDCANVFARLASDLGPEVLGFTGEAFGFASNGGDGLLPVRVAGGGGWSTGSSDAADGLSGIKVSPLHLAQMMAVIGNGGNGLHPRLIAGRTADRPAGRAIDRRTADQLRSVVGDSVDAWVPAASASWSLVSARAGGRDLVVAVLLDTRTKDTERAGEIARRIASAGE
ncbi:penicillin-binding transpeptidase domain-containing protein [Streptomyces sp. NPDC049906]|uniref:penicillin-binding transpeptidase domain-containing protein n=1 Tax=Streptomyces sp. NPDC049906 TaxID=3155656 RepID=UPI00341AC4A9